MSCWTDIISVKSTPTVKLFIFGKISLDKFRRAMIILKVAKWLGFTANHSSIVTIFHLFACLDEIFVVTDDRRYIIPENQFKEIEIIELEKRWTRLIELIWESYNICKLNRPEDFSRFSS